MRVNPDCGRQLEGLFGRRLRGLLLVAFAVMLSNGSLMGQEPPVVSFEPVAPDDQPGEPPNGDVVSAPESTLSFSFRFAPWEDVLIKFADIADLTLDLTDVPGGTFNYYDKGHYTPREAIDVLNGYLLQRGFVLVRRDRFLVCVNLEKGLPANLVPMVTVDELPALGKNELASVIFAGNGLDATLAATQIKQLQGSHGKVVSMTATNSLLVTDTGDNLRLFDRLLSGGAFRRRASSGSGPAFQAFTLQYVRADETERLIRTLFGLPRSSFSASDTEPRGAGPADLKITTDTRSNRLFVTATSSQLASIEQIIEAYDVDDASPDAAPRRAPATTRVLPLPNADLIIIGRALESLSPRIRVSATRSTRPPAGGTTTDGASADKPSPQPAAGSRPAATTPKRQDGRSR